MNRQEASSPVRQVYSRRQLERPDPEAEQRARLASRAERRYELDRAAAAVQTELARGGISPGDVTKALAQLNIGPLGPAGDARTELQRAVDAIKNREFSMDDLHREMGQMAPVPVPDDERVRDLQQQVVELRAEKDDLGAEKNKLAADNDKLEKRIAELEQQISQPETGSPLRKGISGDDIAKALVTKAFTAKVTNKGGQTSLVYYVASMTATAWVEWIQELDPSYATNATQLGKQVIQQPIVVVEKNDSPKALASSILKRLNAGDNPDQAEEENLSEGY